MPSKVSIVLEALVQIGSRIAELKTPSSRMGEMRVPQAVMFISRYVIRVRGTTVAADDLRVHLEDG